MAALTTAQRMAMYKRIFAGIPRSFLNPDHPNNQAIIGAIAHACAYVEAIYRELEDGLFLDTATDETGNAVGGVSALARWGVWLKMPQLPGETPGQYRIRLMQKLFTPKVTIKAITETLQAATGIAIAIEEPHDQVVELDDGPWEGKRLGGEMYNVMVVHIVTGQGGDAIPNMMGFLRAAGVHWWHIERVRHEIELSWEGQQASTFVTAWDSARFYRLSYRPDDNTLPDGKPLDRRFLYHGGTSLAVDVRSLFRPRVMLLSGAIDAPIITVDARTDLPDDLPVLSWDDSRTLWEEAVWAD
jgi:hypothetical protein